MRFNKDGAARVTNSEGSHVDNAEEGRGVVFLAFRLILGVGEEEERGLAFADLEPEITEGFGPRGGAPGGNGVGGKSGADPVEEGLRRRESDGRRGRGCTFHRYRVEQAVVTAGERGGRR